MKTTIATFIANKDCTMGGYVPKSTWRWIDSVQRGAAVSMAGEEFDMVLNIKNGKPDVRKRGALLKGVEMWFSHGDAEVSESVFTEVPESIKVKAAEIYSHMDERYKEWFERTGELLRNEHVPSMFQGLYPAWMPSTQYEDMLRKDRQDWIDLGARAGTEAKATALFKRELDEETLGELNLIVKRLEHLKDYTSAGILTRVINKLKG